MFLLRPTRLFGWDVLKLGGIFFFFLRPTRLFAGSGNLRDVRPVGSPINRELAGGRRGREVQFSKISEIRNYIK